MGINTNLNIDPYYDDYDSTKDYHRVLFKPSYPVQARELTQLQTILQSQIERFGDNILVEGTIVDGCNFSRLEGVSFVKILDNDTDSVSVIMENYVDAKAVGVTTGVEAVVIKVAVGLESQSPNLNTLFVKYIETGTSDEKVFSTTENIEIRNLDTDELIATVIAAGTVDDETLGSSSITKVSDGIIYQKGHFVRVEEQSVVVSAYSAYPDEVVVGFRTDESIVNSYNDTSLLDNAAGYNNENAPGADRLQLTAVLTVYSLIDAKLDERFFAIEEYTNGQVSRRNTTTAYNKIYDFLAQRTKEESGNYTVRDFPLRVSDNTANSDLLTLNIGAGVAYVEGRRVELVNNYTLDFNKAFDYNTEDDQTISTNIGNYIEVTELYGNFDSGLGATIDLYDTALAAATGSGISLGGANKIGEAKTRAFTYEDGTMGDEDAVYRLYLFDVTMDADYNWDDVAAVYYDGNLAASK